MTGAVRCANPRCRRDGDPDPVYGREVICGYCTDRLERQLADLPAANEQLATVLTAASDGAMLERITGSRSPAAPVRLDVADHRDHIHALLVSWTRLVIEERALSGWPADTIEDLAGFLIAHLDWLQDHPAAGDLCDEVGRALGQARSLLTRPEPACTLPCPAEGCEGGIRVTADTITARCGDCGWHTDDLLALGRLLRGDEPVRVTAYEACHRLLAEGRQATPSTIRSWTRRGRIQVVGRDGNRNLYDLRQLRDLARQVAST